MAHLFVKLGRGAAVPSWTLFLCEQPPNHASKLKRGSSIDIGTDLPYRQTLTGVDVQKYPAQEMRPQKLASKIPERGEPQGAGLPLLVLPYQHRHSPFKLRIIAMGSLARRGIRRLQLQVQPPEIARGPPTPLALSRASTQGDTQCLASWNMFATFDIVKGIKPLQQAKRKLPVLDVSYSDVVCENPKGRLFCGCGFLWFLHALV